MKEIGKKRERKLTLIAIPKMKWLRREVEDDDDEPHLLSRGSLEFIRK